MCVYTHTYTSAYVYVCTSKYVCMHVCMCVPLRPELDLPISAQAFRPLAHRFPVEVKASGFTGLGFRGCRLQT